MGLNKGIWGLGLAKINIEIIYGVHIRVYRVEGFPRSILGPMFGNPWTPNPDPVHPKP